MSTLCREANPSTTCACLRECRWQRLLCRLRLHFGRGQSRTPFGSAGRTHTTVLFDRLQEET